MRAFWLFLLILAGAVSAFPAFAQVTYSVTGIAADDVLNIRERPSASSPKIGEYGPSDSGIVIYRRSGNWALVGRSTPGAAEGWVNSRFLTRVVAAARVRFPLRCLGTEPFWDLNIRSERAATFASPEVAGDRLAVSNVRREGRNASMRIGSGGRADITAGSCSDGMSDNSYRYSIFLRLTDGRVFRGCCR
jgi:uncharacterized membrane protein